MKERTRTTRKQRPTVGTFPSAGTHFAVPLENGDMSVGLPDKG